MLDGVLEMTPAVHRRPVVGKQHEVSGQINSIKYNGPSSDRKWQAAQNHAAHCRRWATSVLLSGKGYCPHLKDYRCAYTDLPGLLRLHLNLTQKCSHQPVRHTRSVQQLDVHAYMTGAKLISYYS